MTLLLYDPDFEKHLTGYHPESPLRTQNAWQRLRPYIDRGECLTKPTQPVTRSLLAAVHHADQIAQIESLARQGGGAIDGDTFVSPASWQVALKAAGMALTAVETVMDERQDTKHAFCLIRPPGHHATDKQSMGFCLFNNIALAARYAQRVHGVERILIVDWDVHHGNGTQDIFYDDDGVYFLSLHRFPFYPGTGHESETGTGRGLGYTANIPLAFGCSREQYMSAFDRALDRACKRIKPQLILVSAGFDAHRQDPVGNLGLESEDYAILTDKVAAAAQAFCQGRLISCLEGGYDIYALAESAEIHLQRLIKTENSSPSLD